MYRTISLIFIVAFINIAVLPVFAQSVHKWIDENGVTHYSDEAPASPTAQVTLIGFPEAYSASANIEDSYYSITNQWMRLHAERLALEKIKLEKAKQKAEQQPIAPQVVYVNEPNENRCVIANPGFFHPKSRQHFFHRNRHDSDQRVSHHRTGNSGRVLGHRRGHALRSHSESSGLAIRF